MLSAMPHGASVWAEAAEPAPEARPFEGDRRADVVIVGAGYTGLSAALHLAERGADVVTLDAAEPGWGASGRNGGQIIPGLKHDPDELERMFGAETGRRMWQIAGAAADTVFELIARHKIACHAERCGWIAAAPHAAALESLRARTEQWQRRGAPVELLDRRRIEALTGTAVYVGGMLDRRAGALHPLSYARGLARAAQRAGAHLHGHSAARRLEPAGPGWRVTTEAGSVQAPAVILATMLGGTRIGIFAAVAGGVLGIFVNFSSMTVDTARVVLLFIYLIVCAITIWGVEHYRAIAARQRNISARLLEEEEYRKQVMDELQHRLKNKISTIHAVLHQVLDLGGEVEGEPRELSMELPCDRERVPGSVEEIGSAESMWPAPASTSARTSERTISRGTTKKRPP